MANHRNGSNGGIVKGSLRDYRNLRTIPAILGVVFVVASAYQFGGIDSLHFEWLDYTLTDQHAVIVSLAALVVAFMSSRTKRFENYSRMEQGLIALVPVLIIGYEYVPQLTDIVNSSDPAGPIIAFVFVLIGWGVAVR